MDPSWLPPAPRFFVFIFQIQYTLCPHLSKHGMMASGSALAVCTPTCQASPCWSCSLLKAGNQTLTALGTMRFGSTAKVLLKCKLKYYRISECPWTVDRGRACSCFHMAGSPFRVPLSVLNGILAPTRPQSSGRQACLHAGVPQDHCPEGQHIGVLPH